MSKAGERCRQRKRRRVKLEREHQRARQLGFGLLSIVGRLNDYTKWFRCVELSDGQWDIRFPFEPVEMPKEGIWFGLAESTEELPLETQL